MRLGRVSIDMIADLVAAEELEAVTLLGEVDLPADLASSNNSAAGDSAMFAAPEATLEVLWDVLAPRQCRLTSSLNLSSRSGRN
jgi:hypothetical protein